MDIFCRHCGEPSDHDDLHDSKYSYQVMSNLFRIYGCGAIDHVWGDKPLLPCDNPVTNQPVAELSAAMQDISPYAEEWSQDFDDYIA